MHDMKIDISQQEQLLFDTTILQDLDLKNKNFIFGKNGVGKSTLIKLIKEQNSDDFDLRIFQGFESVLGEDEKLNAVILGEENKEIQKQVDEEQKKLEGLGISKVKNETLLNSLTSREEGNRNQLLINFEISNQDFEKKNRELGTFYQKSASEITIQFNLGRKYNRNNFEKDIAISQKLTEHDKVNFEKILNESEKQLVPPISLPVLNLKDYVKSTNEILQKNVEVKVVITELENSPKKQEFSQMGLEIHQADEHCAFCGGEITNERLSKLKSYFEADEILALQERVKKGIEKITSEIDILDRIEPLKQSMFYAKYGVKDLNQQIKEKKESYIFFLMECKKKLKEKEKNLFRVIDTLQIEVPDKFVELQTEIDDLIKKNNEFTKNIDKNKSNAKQKLLLNFVVEKCEKGKYEVLKTEKKGLEIIKNTSEKVLKNKIYEITQEKKDIENQIKIVKLQINKLYDKIKNPEIIIRKMNEKLQKSGKNNLKLKYIDSEKHYQILNDDSTTRGITEISTGEKNIIAFLYFIESLNSPELDTGKPKFIIFDDPMNSNDDTMQYLIISEIEKLYNKKKFYEHFLLLTHNSHFYLKVTFARRERRDKKNGYEEDNFIRMNNNGKLTSFMYLKNKKEDFTTQYGSLWKELKFLYEHDKKDFMCNSIRRIIETYIVFNGTPGNNNLESKMLFNTNSHFSEVGDLESDTNGYTRERIIEYLKEYFDQKNAVQHFNNYWKD